MQPIDKGLAMNNYEQLSQIVDPRHFVAATLSNVKKKSIATYNKLTLKPVVLKGDYTIQFTYYYAQKVIHENLPLAEALSTLQTLLEGYFKQGLFQTTVTDYHILSNKKGQLSTSQSEPTKQTIATMHNKVKQHIFVEGQPNDFFCALGIMDETGRVYKKSYDKFKQINKYLEFIEDALDRLDLTKPVNIVDFGCGKAYLTFALYYYIVVHRGLGANIVGLDLKADVIAELNRIKTRLGYHDLRFEQGDIANFKTAQTPDMVVSLHACDTATDYAIYQAIEWGARVILAVPCCQHEALDQLKNEALKPMLNHGIIKEKLATLVTDTLRASLLEVAGYRCDIVEFIDMVHTPKNVLIRAYKKTAADPNALANYQTFKANWQATLTLERLLLEGNKTKFIKNMQ